MKAKKTTTRKYYKNYTQTFNASSSFQTFTVPSSILGNLNVDCVASKGADGNLTGGLGGRVQCSFPATPSSTLYIYVGDIPSAAASVEYNASDIRTNNDGVTDNTSLQSRLIVAGGGGSSGSKSTTYAGGNGGGLEGGSANNNYSGYGGTQSSGGAVGKSGSNKGSPGTFGLGGNPGTNKCGAGGAGWYGGAGGNVYNQKVYSFQGSGGGGSSYTDSSCSSVIHTKGKRSIDWDDVREYLKTFTKDGTEEPSDNTLYRDFYEVKVIKETINNEDKFYGVKEYKRGQYYGN